MYHLRTVKYPAAGATAVLALAGGGILMTTAAAAATAAPATQWSSAQADYTCSLSGYGQGMAPLALSATVSAPDTVAAGTSAPVKLVTSLTQIPAAITARLPQISSFGLSGMSHFTGVAGQVGQADLTGQSSSLGAAAGALTELPSMTAAGTVTPNGAGAWNFTAPRAFQLQPKGAAQLPPLTCTAAKTGTVQITVQPNVAGSGGALGTTLSRAYTCTVAADTATMGTGQILLQPGYSGPGMAGKPENVWLSSIPGAMSGPSFAKWSQWSSAKPMASSASLGLSGAYAGSIPLSWSASQAQSGKFALGGQWIPKTAGMFKLRAPHHFSLKMQSQATTFTLVCTALTTTTTATTVQVQSAMPAPAAQATGAATTNAGAGAATTNAGAPNTGAGGSLHPAVDIALAVAGGVVLLGGSGVMVLTLRRRAHSAL